MYTIIAPVPDNLATAIEPYRQVYDPLAALAPPHITLLAPFQFSAPVEQLYAHLSDISETYAPIRIFVVSWDVYEGKEYQLHLPMTAGQPEIVTLHDDLLTGPLSSLAGQEQSYRPHIVFGRFSDSTSLAEAKKALKPFEPQFKFRVSHIELWQRAEGGHPWQPEMKFSLKATITGRARREGVKG